jgi:hypothetical protein
MIPEYRAGAEQGNRFAPGGRNLIVSFILRSRREEAMVDVLQPFIGGCGPWKPYFADHVTAMKA